METLVAIVYTEKNTAKEVFDTLERLQTEKLIDMHDVAYATKDNKGKLKLHQSANMAAAGATGGAFWGLLIGMLFFAPVFGMILGAGAGALAGSSNDYGIDDDFMRTLSERMKTNGSAIFVLASSVVTDKVVPEISKFGGEVIKSSLSKEADQRLQQALSQGGAAGRMKSA